MRSQNQEQEFNDDGTPRRRYELDEAVQSNTIVRTSIGLALFNAFVLLKNVLFPDKSHQLNGSHGAEALTGSDEQQRRHHATPDAAPIEDVREFFEEAAAYSASFEDNLEPYRTPWQSFSRSGFDFAMYIRGPHAPQFVNDNENLYGAGPGSRINLFASPQGDTISIPPSGSGGSGGGGGSPGSGSGGSPTPPGHDDHPGDNSGPGGEGTPGGQSSGNPVTPSRTNRAPVLASTVNLGMLLNTQTMVLALSDLLQHASDPDGDALRVQNFSSSSGVAKLRSDGTFVFSPDANDTTSVTFTYDVSDGSLSVRQTAYLDLVGASSLIIGTDDADVLIGTPENDVIDARGGNDIVVGLEKDDVIHGGSGNDRIVGGDGNDVIHGDDGDDVIFAGAGNDVVYGDNGCDIIFGEGGNDVLVGGDGNDTISGGNQNDQIAGDSGADKLLGDAGNDVLEGGADDDYLDGGDGDDIAIGGIGSDKVYGGGGSNLFIATSGDGDDSYFGGTGGINTYNAAGISTSTSIDLAAGTATGSQIGSDEISEIQNVVGGSAADTIVGDDAANRITGNAGNDAVQLADGNDTAVATVSDGDDVYDGGEGTDTYDASQTSAPLVVSLAAETASSAETGSDELVSIENVIGSTGADEITGDDVANVLSGLAGDDDIAGGAGADTMIATAGDGDDTYDGGEGSDTYDASATSADTVFDLVTGLIESDEVGTDIVASIENIIAGAGDDTIIANEARNVFVGGEGDDMFVFGSIAATGNGNDCDKILDFRKGDRIDLDDISREFASTIENSLDANISKFTIISDLATFSKPGQMKVKYDVLDGQEVTTLTGNTDYDEDVDFALQIVTDVKLGIEDFHHH